MKNKESKKKESLTTQTPVSENDELKDLMTRSIQWSEAVYNQNKKIHSQLRWMSIAGFVRLFLFLIPLIIGIIYLPPLLGNVWEQYQSVLGISAGIDTDSIKALFEQFSSNTGNAK